MGIFSTTTTHTATAVRPRTAALSRRVRKTPCTRRFRGQLSQGREYSWATGLYYFRARWYDPVTGRWLSNDPIGISGGLNQYVFCANDPVNKIDPFGLYFKYRGKNKAVYMQTIENWKKNLPADAKLRKIVEALDKSDKKFTIKALTGNKDINGKQLERPFTEGAQWLSPNDAGPANIYIDANSYKFDGRTWTFAEALAHELLHAYDWLTDDDRRLDPINGGHPASFNAEEEVVTKEALKCKQ